MGRWWMPSIRLKEDQIDELESLVVRERWDWPFVFSCNQRRDTWPFFTYGWTAKEDRSYFSNALVELVVEHYLDLRPGGGRVKVSRAGAFFTDESRREH